MQRGSFHVVNLGCKVNKVESDSFAAALLAGGWHQSPEEAADLIVVNTCTVTGEADKKARKAVRHALSANRAARVLVTGCAAAINPTEFADMSARVQVAGKAELQALLQMERLGGGDARRAGDADGASGAHGAGGTGDASSAHGAGGTGDASGAHGPSSAHRSGTAPDTSAAPSVGSASGMPAAGSAPLALRLGAGFRTRVGLKVQDGCDHACTYCIVHVARGPAASRPLSDALSEARAYFAQGVRELVLTGIDLGSYRSGSAGLAELCAALLEEADKACAVGELPARLRVSSIEPLTLDEPTMELLAHSGGRVCRHLHLPLQSGSSKVLRDMARPYTAEEFMQLVGHLRALMPSLSLTTDVIVGFPGETDDDFADTLAVVRACRFSKVHVFPYSRRAGTPAAERAGQVPPDLKAARAAELRALSRELRLADLEARRGTTELCLVEGARALTESYHEIAAPEGAKPGALVSVTL